MGYITQLFAYLEYVWDSLITAGFPFVFWVKPRWSISAIPDQTGRVSCNPPSFSHLESFSLSKLMMTPRWCSSQEAIPG